MKKWGQLNDSIKFVYVKPTEDKVNQANKYSSNLIKSEFDRYYNQKILYDYEILMKDNCVYYPEYICGRDDYILFNKLKEELKNNDIVSWSKHNKYENPAFSKTFNMIVEKMAEDFKITVLQSRLNYYKDGNDWKPFHKDRHAYNEIQEDYTLGLSLGWSRELEFKHEETQKVFSFPQNNGDIFGFNKIVNQKFLHSIPKKVGEVNDRISIIMWGIKNDF